MTHECRKPAEFLMRTYTHLPLALLVVAGLFDLTGCAVFPIHGAAEPPTAVKADIAQDTREPGGPVKSGVHFMVPFFPDNTDQCGPAALASVLTYWEIKSDPRTLRDEIYLRRIRGTLSIDLLLAAQARGLQAEGTSGTLDRLRTELGAGRPVIALLNLGWVVYPQGHYVVVTGYDDQRQGVYLHSGSVRDAFVPYSLFLTQWEKTGRWMIQIRPSRPQGPLHE